VFRRCIVAKVILETIAGEENIARLIPRSFAIANVNYTLVESYYAFHRAEVFRGEQRLESAAALNSSIALRHASGF